VGELAGLGHLPGLVPASGQGGAAAATGEVLRGGAMEPMRVQLTPRLERHIRQCGPCRENPVLTVVDVLQCSFVKLTSLEEELRRDRLSQDIR
jgi:hypothetical protein